MQIPCGRKQPAVVIHAYALAPEVMSENSQSSVGHDRRKLKTARQSITTRQVKAMMADSGSPILHSNKREYTQQHKSSSVLNDLCIVYF